MKSNQSLQSDTRLIMRVTLLAILPLALFAVWQRYQEKGSDPFRIIEVSNGQVVSIAFDAQKNNLVVSSGNKRKPDSGLLTVWDYQNDRIKRTQPTSSLIQHLLTSPDGSVLAPISVGWLKFAFQDVETGVSLQPVDVGRDGYESIAVASNRKFFATAGSYLIRAKMGGWTSGGGQIRIWEAATGKLLCTIRDKRREIRSADFSPDNFWIASGSTDGRVFLQDVKTGKQVRHVGRVTGSITSVAYSPNGELLAIGQVRGHRDESGVVIWNLRTDALALHLPGLQEHVESIAFSPDGKFLATANYGWTISLWEMPTGRRINTLTIKDRRNHEFGWDQPQVAFSPDGRFIAGSGGSQVKIWEVKKLHSS